MNRHDVYKHFGSISATARALGVTRQSVSMWPDIVPLHHQLLLEKLTGGALRPSHPRLDKMAAIRQTKNI